MKKYRFLSLAMCLLVILQSVMLPVQATALPDASETTSATEETVPVESQGSTVIDIPFGQVSIMNGCRTIEGKSPLGGSERKLDTAQAAFVYEAKTGTVIYSYNPDAKVSPGTLVKIVTALVVCELCELDEEVTVSSRNISRLPAGSQNEKLKEGEKLTVRDLLHCLLLHSANDAAVALAEHVSGNQQGFLVLMNDRVKQMGCTSTDFNNVHGLDNATNYTTARDLTRIVIEATKNETFQEIFKTPKYTVPTTNRTDKERPLTTQNYLIDQSIIPQFFDSRVTGGMASYSEPSGANLVCTAEYKDMQLVFVLTGALREFAENGWSVMSYGNFNEMIDLMEYTFNGYKVNRILYDGQAFEQFSVAGGECNVVGQPHVDYDSVLPADVTMDKLIVTPDTGGTLTAPVAVDDVIATVEIWYRNSCIAEAELYAMSNVRSVDNSGVSIQSGISRTDSDTSGFMSVVGTVCVMVLGALTLYGGINYLRRLHAQKRRRRRRANRRRSY